MTIKNWPGAPLTLSVGEAVRLRGLSSMTLHREIQADRFPAGRIGGRLIIPTQAISEMLATATRETPRR
ncbi:hypothetical protein ACIB24_04615 [Spongisporangium articulatum]|uniref:Helix-turn-helix domain-containing protein n=1 Tax=Spongisporangium articulatum TaxID=3362603 RepID=A0ABW8AIZ3_9ACTN